MAVAHEFSRVAIQKVRYGTGKGAFLSGFVSGVKSINGFSTNMGYVMTVTSVAFPVALPGAIFWDGASILSEGALLYMNAQNPTFSMVNATNGAVIDTITPSGRAGAVINVFSKIETQVQ